MISFSAVWFPLPNSHLLSPLSRSIAFPIHMFQAMRGKKVGPQAGLTKENQTKQAGNTLQEKKVQLQLLFWEEQDIRQFLLQSFIAARFHWGWISWGTQALIHTSGCWRAPAGIICRSSLWPVLNEMTGCSVQSAGRDEFGWILYQLDEARGAQAFG